MFGNLIESGSHREELARKGSFFLGTLALYAILLSGAGVASIYAFNVRLDNENLELIGLVTPVPPLAEQRLRQETRPNTSLGHSQPVRTNPTETINPQLIPKEISVKNNSVKPAFPGFVTTNNESSDAASIEIGPPSGLGDPAANGRESGIRVKESSAPPPLPRPTPSPTPVKLLVSSQVLNGRATSLPAPPYPPIAKAIHASGMVTVQVLIDEQGRVISAQATGGPPTLRGAAVEAAYRARFTPTYLSNVPVKVSGFITYNFVLE